MIKNKTRKGTPDIMGNLMTGELLSIEPAITEPLNSVSNINSTSDSLELPEQENHKESVTSFSDYSEQESNKTIKQENHRAVAPASKKAIKLTSTKAIQENHKEKATFNLDSTTLEALDDMWISLRRVFKNEQRVTKTLIVEKAIEIVLEEFNAKGESSKLYKKLKI